MNDNEQLDVRVYEDFTVSLFKCIFRFLSSAEIRNEIVKYHRHFCCWPKIFDSWVEEKGLDDYSPIVDAYYELNWLTECFLDGYTPDEKGIDT